MKKKPRPKAKAVATKTAAKKPKAPSPRTVAAFCNAIVDGRREVVAKHLPDLANAARKGKYGGTDPPLVIAAGVHANVEIVRILLDAGADTAGTSVPYRQTALHVACSQNQLETVALLIERGAPLDGKDFDGETPYMLARHPEIRARLRAAGVAGFAGRGGKKLRPKKTVLKRARIEADDGRIAFDSEGRAWIASHEGIYCRSGETVTRYTFERDLNGATGWRTSGIGRGPDGKIYIGTGDGLIEVAADAFTHFERRCSELVDASYTATGPDGRVYMVSRETEETWPVPQYITVFDGASFTRLVAGRDLPEGLTISCLAFDPDGRLVIGAAGAIAFQRDGAWHVERDDHRFASVYDILVERDVIWTGGQGGVVEYRDGRSQVHRTESLAKRLAKLGSDLYIGLYGYEDGIVCLRDGTVETVAVQQDQLPAGMISDLAAGPDGKIWVVVGDGVATI